MTLAVAGHVIGVVMTSSPGPTPEREQRQVHRRGSRRDRQRVLCTDVLGEATLELGRGRPRRQPARAEGLGDGSDLLLADGGGLKAEEGLF